MDDRGQHTKQIPREMARRKKLNRNSPWRKGPHCKTPTARESWEKLRGEGGECS